MPDCLFCKIIAGEIPSYPVYRDEHVYAFLNIFPFSKGHTLIVPIEHAENLSENSKEAGMYLMEALYKVAPKILEAMGATGYNLGMNHGVDAGQEVFHTHLHVIPRYEGDPRSFKKRSPSTEELTAISTQIRTKTMP